MPISDFVKKILRKYGIPQTQSHIDRVCQFLRENNPKNSKWSEDSNLKLPTKDEVLRLFCVSAKPCQEVEAEGGPCSISFICQDTENRKDTIYDKVLSYFDLSEEIEPDIQKIFLNGTLFPEMQSKRCLLVPSILKLNEPSFGMRTKIYETPNQKSFVLMTQNQGGIGETSDLEKIVNNIWDLIQPPALNVITDLVLKSGLTDNHDVAEAAGKAGIFLTDWLLQVLQGRIQLGETKPMWVKSNKIQSSEAEAAEDLLMISFGNSSPGVLIDDSQVKISPTVSAQLTLLLKNSRTMTFELRVSNFFLATLDTHPINFEAFFSFPMIELWFRIY